MMRMLKAQPLVFQQAKAANLGIDRREDLVDQTLIADQAIPGGRFALDEQQHRQAVTEGESDLGGPSLCIAFVRRNNPNGIGMLV